MGELVRDTIRSMFHVNPDDPSPVGTRRRYGKRELLPGLCAALGHQKGAEIGVRSGGFAQRFCEAIPGLEMFCIDPWSLVPNYSQERQAGNYEKAVQRLSPYPGVKLIKKTSVEALADVPDGYLDFIHIDGRHEFDYVMDDLIHWGQKVRKGGLVMAHDYHLSGVMYAVNAYTAAHHIDPWFKLKADQPTVFWVNP